MVWETEWLTEQSSYGKPVGHATDERRLYSPIKRLVPAFIAIEKLTYKNKTVQYSSQTKNTVCALPQGEGFQILNHLSTPSIKRYKP